MQGLCHGICNFGLQDPISERTLPVSVPPSYSYKVPDTDTTIRLGSASPSLYATSSACSLFASTPSLDLIAAHGADGEIGWETNQGQYWGYNLGDGGRIAVMNLAGKVVLWNELQECHCRTQVVPR